VPSNLILIAVFAHQTETSQVISESRSGMYGWFEYILAQSFLQIVLLPLCTLSVLVVGFGMGNWATEHFLQCWLIYTLGYWVFEGVSQCLAVRPLHVLLNMMDFANFWFASFLFCGMVLPQEDVIWPLRLLTYILPFKYWLRCCLWLIMVPQKFEGAEYDASATMGFVCGPDVSPAACFGPTGCEALDTAHRLFDAMSCTDTRAQDTMYLLIMIGVCKFLFSVGLCGRCKGLSPLRALRDTRAYRSLKDCSSPEVAQVAPCDTIGKEAKGNMEVVEIEPENGMQGAAKEDVKGDCNGETESYDGPTAVETGNVENAEK